MAACGVGGCSNNVLCGSDELVSRKASRWKSTSNNFFSPSREYENTMLAFARNGVMATFEGANTISFRVGVFWPPVRAVTSGQAFFINQGSAADQRAGCKVRIRGMQMKAMIYAPEFVPGNPDITITPVVRISVVLDRGGIIQRDLDHGYVYTPRPEEIWQVDGSGNVGPTSCLLASYEERFTVLYQRVIQLSYMSDPRTLTDDGGESFYSVSRANCVSGGAWIDEFIPLDFYQQYINWDNESAATDTASFSPFIRSNAVHIYITSNMDLPDDAPPEPVEWSVPWGNMSLKAFFEDA